MARYIDAESIRLTANTVIDPESNDVLVPLEAVKRAIAQAPTVTNGCMNKLLSHIKEQETSYWRMLMELSDDLAKNNLDSSRINEYYYREVELTETQDRLVHRYIRMMHIWSTYYRILAFCDIMRTEEKL